VIGQTTRVARAILEALRPLLGSAATGRLTVKATGADVTLRCGSFANIVAESPATGLLEVRRDVILRTRRDVIANTVGVPVDVISLGGGQLMNQAAATAVIWDPPLTGIETTSVVAAGGLTGGADSVGLGSVKQVVWYETIGGASVARDLFAASVAGDTPAVVLGWDSSQEVERMGRGRGAYVDSWTVYVVTSRGEGSHDRRDEGLAIVDAVRSYLVDLGAVGGFNLSDPPIKVGVATRLAIAPTSYVYALKIQTFVGLEKAPRFVDPAALVFGDEGIAFAEWVRTRIDLDTATIPPFPVVDGNVVGMFLDGFDDGFDEGFA
jgi:hypothetical protein